MADERRSRRRTADLTIENVDDDATRNLMSQMTPADLMNFSQTSKYFERLSRPVRMNVLKKFQKGTFDKMKELTVQTLSNHPRKRGVRIKREQDTYVMGPGPEYKQQLKKGKDIPLPTFPSYPLISVQETQYPDQIATDPQQERTPSFDAIQHAKRAMKYRDDVMSGDFTVPAGGFYGGFAIPTEFYHHNAITDPRKHLYAQYGSLQAGTLKVMKRLAHAHGYQYAVGIHDNPPTLKDVTKPPTLEEVYRGEASLELQDQDSGDDSYYNEEDENEIELEGAYNDPNA